MEPKTLLKSNIDGKILAIVTTNDPSLFFGETEMITDISKHKNRDKIIENSRHFKLENKKVVELSQEEKNKIDDEKVVIPTNPVWGEIQKISDRLAVIESQLLKK